MCSSAVYSPSRSLLPDRPPVRSLSRPRQASPAWCYLRVLCGSSPAWRRTALNGRSGYGSRGSASRSFYIFLYSQQLPLFSIHFAGPVPPAFRLSHSEPGVSHIEKLVTPCLVYAGVTCPTFPERRQLFFMSPVLFNFLCHDILLTMSMCHASA